MHKLNHQSLVERAICNGGEEQTSNGNGSIEASSPDNDIVPWHFAFHISFFVSLTVYVSRSVGRSGGEHSSV